MDRVRLGRGLWIWLAIGALLRIARIAFGTPVIEVEGVEYTRLAQNLWHDGQYLGILRGSERMFPPLYPLLIGLLERLGIEVVLAGRLVSLAAGVATIGVGARLSARLFGKRTALLTAAILALHPGLIIASAAVFSEMTSTAFVFAGALILAQSLQTSCRRRALAGGALLAAAYLTRVEMLAIAGFTGLLFGIGLLLRPAITGKKKIALVLLTLLSFCVVAAPYPHYLWRTTGELRLQAKSERVLATIGRFASGQDFQTASFELGAGGTERGPWLSPNEDFRPIDARARSEAPPMAFMRYWKDNALAAAFLLLSGKGAISIAFLLAALYLFWRARREPALSEELWTEGQRRFITTFLLGFIALVFLTGIFYKITLRYFIPIAVPFAIFAARALIDAEERTRSRRLLARPTVAYAAMLGVLLLSTSRGALSGFREFGEAHARHEITREVGLHLAGSKPHAVMSQEPRFAYYAGAIWEPLPVVTKIEDLLARANARAVDAIVLRYSEDGRELGLFDRVWTRDQDPPEGWRISWSNAEVTVLVRKTGD